jgi:two-component system chemotaxis response regulator CheY
MNDSKNQKKPTVMIVDDVAFVRTTLAAILHQNGYHVVAEASSGVEAVEQYEKFSPDLVTMDVVMPKMSGIEATRKILKTSPDARIVVISAMGQETLVMEAIHAGARDYILKPFSAAEILKTLEHALSDHPRMHLKDHAAGA